MSPGRANSFSAAKSYGWEAMIFRDADLRIGRRFILREEAIGWAESERKDLEKGGLR